MDIRVIFIAIVGFFAGINGFFRGFWIYREYRLLADTPETPIRSLSMGLAEIHGQAKGGTMLLSPVTCTHKREHFAEADSAGVEHVAAARPVPIRSGRRQVLVSDREGMAM